MFSFFRRNDTLHFYFDLLSLKVVLLETPFATSRFWIKGLKIPHTAHDDFNCRQSLVFILLGKSLHNETCIFSMDNAL